MIKILVVENSYFMYKVIQNVFSQDHYVVSYESKGSQVISKALKDKPDVILMSLILEDNHGFDICMAIKRNDALCDIPVIFITSSDDKKSIEEGYACGAVDYVIKPFENKDLFARVNKFCRFNAVN